MSTTLSSLTKTPTNEPIPPSLLQTALSSPPFIPLPSALNFRDIGLLPSSPIPPGLIYRSGTLPPSQSLSTLHLSLILDLRSAREVQASPDPVIEGVENVWIEPRGGVKGVDLEEFREDGGVKGYVGMYLDILEGWKESWRVGLEWVVKRGQGGKREGEGGMVVHCTAGKDRTGVFAALLLSLAGAEREVIAYDYELTRIGIEPSREVLTQMLLLWNKEWTSESPGMREFTQIKGEYILAFLDAVDVKYGGVDAYVRDELEFSAEEVGTMKRVLRGEA